MTYSSWLRSGFGGEIKSHDTAPIIGYTQPETTHAHLDVVDEEKLVLCLAAYPTGLGLGRETMGRLSQFMKREVVILISAGR